MSVTDSSNGAAVETEELAVMRNKAYQICGEYLAGTWKTISSSEMIFRPFEGGLSNLLYYCSLPETHTPLDGEPSEALLRIYGQSHEGHPDFTITESVVFMMLSERKLGPKLYGIFPGGRLEEFIPSRTVTSEEQKDPEISAQIARKMAKFHALRAPVSKKPTWIFSYLEEGMDVVRSTLTLESVPDDKRSLLDKVLSVGLEGELSWLKSYLKTVESPIVFSHNDLQKGNILLPDHPQNTEDKLVFIDFEFCNYNHRGYDIAVHFCEWGFDLCVPDYPYFTHDDSDYPSKQQKLNFVRAYLSAMEPATCKEESLRRAHIDTESHLLEEIDAYVLSSHMIAVVWALQQINTSKIKFGFLQFASDRLDEYFRWKQHLTAQGYIKQQES